MTRAYYNGRIRSAQSHARFGDWDAAARAGFSPKEAADASWAGRTKEKVETKPTPGIVWRCAADIEIEPITWLWPRRIARGKHTCIAGDPGTGKSQVVIVAAAAVSRGSDWPCGEGQAPTGNVIILSAEDAASDTLVPRLLAAGADLKRIRVIDAVRESNGSERFFNLKTDIAKLEKMIREWGDVLFVGIDTVNSYLGKTDSYKNPEVRAVLDPLSRMAELLRVGVLSVNHLSKGGSNSTTKALHRFLGSIGFVGSPRVAFAAFADPDDPARRLLLHAKNNIAPPAQGLAYRLQETIVETQRQERSRLACGLGTKPCHRP
jgi:RecA-family ATPase